ncbi:MAG: helix-turn-helix domain-containing protein [Planctomycetaceae bacterium]|nr:helix-turn-helix domain-containing protein [Planctomycetaceae bacterium]
MSIVNQFREDNRSDAVPLLVPAGDVAKMLEVSERTVWRLLSGGQLVHPVRLGGSVRWRVEDVKRWIADGCPKTGRWEG